MGSIDSIGHCNNTRHWQWCYCRQASWSARRSKFGRWTEAGGGMTLGSTSSKIVLRMFLSMMCWASNTCCNESLVCSGDLIFKLCFSRAGAGEDCGNIGSHSCRCNWKSEVNIRDRTGWRFGVFLEPIVFDFKHLPYGILSLL